MYISYFYICVNIVLVYVDVELDVNGLFNL